MRIIVLALALCAATASASAATLRAEYSLSLMGLTVGQAKLKAALNGTAYKAEVEAKLTGIAAVAGGRGGAVAEGTIGAGKLLPASFTIAGRSGKAQQSVQMALASGNVAGVEITPPYEPKPDRVLLQDGHKRGIVDPVSSLLMPVQGTGNPLDPSTCNRTIPVFDGAARFDIVLSYSSTRNVRKPGYDGPVLVCDVRYVPIAGHRALRPATKFMRENKEMSVWLAPVAGTRVVMPIRIAIMTTIGMSVIEAETWSVDAGSTAAIDSKRSTP